MLRVIVPVQEGSEIALITLDAAESHHLSVVRRARPGQIVEALDGAGGIYQCRVASCAKRQVTLSVEEQRREPLALPRISLGFGIPKGRLIEAIIQKATELGVSQIQPLICDHCDVHIEGGKQHTRIERWASIANEACKQSGNPWFPTIAPLRSAADWFASGEGPGRFVAALAEERVPLLAALQELAPMPQQVTIAIGPEGDFSNAEYAVAQNMGWRFVTLAQRVLRCETAAVTALAQVVGQIESSRIG